MKYILNADLEMLFLSDDFIPIAMPKPDVFVLNSPVFWAFEGCLGALECTLSEAGHLWYGRRYFCMDPVWRKMVGRAGEWQGSPGTHFFCCLLNTDKEPMLLSSICQLVIQQEMHFLHNFDGSVYKCLEREHFNLPGEWFHLVTRWYSSTHRIQGRLCASWLCQWTKALVFWDQPWESNHVWHLDAWWSTGAHSLLDLNYEHILHYLVKGVELHPSYFKAVDGFSSWNINLKCLTV